jgi:hypothetical protein
MTIIDAPGVSRDDGLMEAPNKEGGENEKETKQKHRSQISTANSEKKSRELD